jgi:hypothetical protein
MILDIGSKRIVDGTVREDDILKENVTSKSFKTRMRRTGLSER